MFTGATIVAIVVFILYLAINGYAEWEESREEKDDGNE